ncbi:condensation domain-containing protein [Streptomyces enissocaesilis]|uniref:Condensation domain-containing protein n=1 Tax=Streptomyces enissocaesilis TaxID=332589 RepID=A0ABN3X6M6_9ACTN
MTTSHKLSLPADGPGLQVEFAGASGADGPLTWGQREIWEVLRWKGADRSALNVKLVVDVPPGLSCEALIPVIERLVVRHEALRTTFRADADLGARQTVHGSGCLAVARRVHASATEPSRGTANRLAAELLHRPFGEDEFPTRWGLVVDARNRPRHLVVALSHLAVDGPSRNIVQRELGTLLRRGALEPRAPQPLQRVAFEQSAPGRQAHGRSLDHWRKWFADVPSVMLREAVPVTGGHADAAAAMSSPALSLGAAVLACRSGLTAPQVVLAMTSAVLGDRLGLTECGLRVLVGTRFRSGLREYVGPINQNAAVHTSWSPADELVSYLRRAAATAVRSYLRTECDPGALMALETEAAERRSVERGGYCFFNDLRDAHRESEPRDAPEVLGSGALAELLPRTTVVPVPYDPAMNANLFLNLISLQDIGLLDVRIRSGFLGVTAGEFLLKLESAICEGARGNRRITVGESLDAIH